MTETTNGTQSRLLRRLRRAVLGVVAFQIATAIVVLGVIDGEVPLAITSVTCLIVIGILALALFRKLGPHFRGTQH
jgi:integral membrane sensor domain MASE1